MSLITRFLSRLFGRGEDKPAEQPGRQHVPTQNRQIPKPTNRYENADTGPENIEHWKYADLLSAGAANSPQVRSVLRSRSRHELGNNGYYKGLVRGRTNDTIGTGPRLQIDIPETTFDPDMQREIAISPPGVTMADLARKVELRWTEWCESNLFSGKLRILATAEDIDGEGVGLLVERKTAFPVKLGFRVVECDRLATPDLLFDQPDRIDGIVFDRSGEPIIYHILRRHPGDLNSYSIGFAEYDSYQADQVIHLFECDRPEQYRGVPILTPALGLYAILRRYTLAELGAAELGAMIAGVIENPNLPPDSSGDDAPIFDTMDQVPFARNALLTMPAGAVAKAFDAKNPNSNSPKFKSDILTEAGRSAGEMRNTATGSSAEYNYSSGRLDHLPRQRGIEIRRERWESCCLDRVFLAWYAEAVLIPGYLPDGLPDVAEWEWGWHWDGFPSIDPEKDAKAAEIEKRIGMTTDSEILAKKGKDWREHYRQLAREKALREELDIEPKIPAAPGQQAAPTAPVETEEVPADE